MSIASRVPTGILSIGLALLAGCELDDVVAPAGERIVVVTAILRPDIEYQYVIVEQTLEGTVERPDSSEFPVPPHSPRFPLDEAVVTVANLELPDDPCGNPVEFRDIPYAPQTGSVPGLYWAPSSCPTMRPGDRLQLRVQTADGEVVTGVTRVPGMRSAFLARGRDSVQMGGGDSVMTFNRDRDTLRFGVDAIHGRSLQLNVRRDGYLSDFGTTVQVDTTAFLLAGNAIDVFVAGTGEDVFRGGRSYVVTLTLTDTNYYDFTRSSNNELTGRGFINHLEGGIGVFGSAVAATSRVWSVADADDPREGCHHLSGSVDTVAIDADLCVYLHQPVEGTEVSAFLEGGWFTPNPNSGRKDEPDWLARTVAGKSVDGDFVAERLRLVVPDTLPSGFVTYITLTGVYSATDSMPVFVAELGLAGEHPIDTLLAVRLRELHSSDLTVGASVEHSGPRHENRDEEVSQLVGEPHACCHTIRKGR